MEKYEFGKDINQVNTLFQTKCGYQKNMVLRFEILRSLFEKFTGIC